MGNYNSQYANYYGTLSNKRQSSNSAKKIIPTLDKKFFIRRITIELVGTFLLFAFVIACKIVVTPTTNAVYKYSKKVVSNNFNVQDAISKVKSIKLSDAKVFYEKNIKGISSEKVEENMTDWLDSMITKVTGKKSWKAVVKEEFIKPVDGKILSAYGGENKGVYIDLTEGTEVKSCYQGTIKECGEDKKLGQYIVIAHDNNVETKYGNLKELNVKKGDVVKKSQMIGKSGGIGKSSAPHLYFEINQMGESKNPQDYFDFKTK